MIGRIITLCCNMKRSSIVKFVKYKKAKDKTKYEILAFITLQLPFAEKREKMMTCPYVLVYA